MTDLVALNGVSKHFGGVAALDNVSLSIAPGEAVALMGGNGAGKSTLVSILAGLQRPDSGSLWIEGREQRFEEPQDARNLGIETVFQNLALCGNLDAPGNLFLGRELGWGVRPFRFLNRRAMVEETRHTLEQLGVRIPDLSATASSYSGGQRQALAFARAVRSRSRLLMLDEPTAALGVEESANVVATVRRLREERGMAVLLITHNLEEMRKIAHRAVVLRRGRLVGSVSLDAVDDDRIVGMITGSIRADTPIAAHG
jgi:ABC-type sugar transport system ATPase subunit